MENNKKKQNCPNCAIGILVYRALYTHHVSDIRLDIFRSIDLNSLSVKDLKSIWDDIESIVSE
jgi:hypothetical protein